MIESTNPDIDVQQLMKRVHREVAKVRQTRNSMPVTAPAAPAVPLPPLPETPPPPVFGSSGPVEIKKSRLEAMLTEARKTTEVSRSIPKFLRGLFRKQGSFNRALLDTVASLTKTNTQLAGRVHELQNAAQQQTDWIRILLEHRAADQAWMKAATPAISSFGTLHQRVTAIEVSAAHQLHTSESQAQRFEDYRDEATEHLRSVQRDFRSENDRAGEHLRTVQRELRAENDRAGEHLRNLQVQVDRQSDFVRDLKQQGERQNAHLGNLQTQVDTSGEHLRNLQRTADQLLAIYEQNERAAEHLRNLQVQVDRQSEFLQDLRQQGERQNAHLGNLQDFATNTGEHLRNLQDETDRAADLAKDLPELKVTSARLDAEIEQLAYIRQTLGRLEERQTNDSIYLKGRISQHSEVLQQWLRSTSRKKPPAEPAPADASVSAPAPLPIGELDQFYLDFENRFRGTREEIKDRVRHYLPLLKEAKAGTSARPILDVGCGRGEWLELLDENGLTASGVDLNQVMVTQCTERNLSAVYGDAIEHLRSLPPNSQGGVSGFHIIEHLPFEVLLQLFAQTLRVLKPGGVALFESPNCKNFSVGACYFNVDPTHRNPVFPDTAAFMMEIHGFDEVRLDYLSPGERRLVNGDQDAEFLNDLLFGAQDFAVIGRKPRSR